MGFIKYITIMLLTAIFGIALFTFAVNFGYDNEANINIADEGDYNISRTNMESDIDEFYIDVNGTAMPQYQESSAGSQVEITERGAPFKVTWSSSSSMVKHILKSAWGSIFGNDTGDSDDSGFGIILLAIFSLIGITWILYSYKAWFGRNPD
jgi:hypothetical protein